ncbi:activator-dependent family glycosyltransferase [Micromonospora sp. NPDC005553]|uniref:activator-dependent family glycosyltransferase n=1 Tax=Micromonospora sp. NPDC005553 TaxID=3364232 RepID=UPI0036A7F5F2
MRVLFVAPPDLKSHLYIMTPLAWALRTAGHDVRVACQPGSTEALAQAGLTAVLAGEPMAETLAEVDEMSEPPKRQAAPATLPVQTDYARDDPYAELEYLTTNLLPFLHTDEMLTDLIGFARAWRPDLVLWDAMTYAGPVVARACGAAHARILFGTDAFVQLWEAVRAAGGSRPDPMRAWLEPLLRTHGGGAFADDVVHGQWTIDTMPPWTWRPSSPHYIRMRHLAFNGPSVVPRWLYEPPVRPRVCVTLGMTHREADVAEASAVDLLEAVGDLDIEVVATMSAEQLASVPRIPDNVRVVDFVPMNVLLPTCSAIVHHGGSSTMASAFEHAVPQLIVPSAYWSEKWFGPVAQANGLQERGAGVWLAYDSDHLTRAGLREDLMRVLKDPSFKENAVRLRTEMMGLPTPNEVVPAVEKLTAAYRRAG